MRALRSSRGKSVRRLGVLGAIVVMLPVLVLFLFLQRYFVQGIAGTGLR